MPTTNTTTSGRPATVLICQPASTPADQLSSRAYAILARHGGTSPTSVRHLRTRPCRVLRHLPFIATIRRLLRRTSVAAARLSRVDITGMRQQAYHAAAQRWLVWEQVADGTPPARPFDWYCNQVVAHPRQWTVARAQREYWGQPRLRAMALYNADPHRVCDLPVAEIEMFQTGRAFYCQYHQLAALPAAGVIDATGTVAVAVMRPDEDVDDLIDYVARANQVLAGLPRRTHLIAVAG